MEVLHVSACKTCMKWRGRFILWLGKILGVMTDAPKEKKVEQKGFTQDQIAAIIGTKEMELIALRMELQAARAEIESLKNPSNVTPISEAAK